MNDHPSPSPPRHVTAAAAVAAAMVAAAAFIIAIMSVPSALEPPLGSLCQVHLRDGTQPTTVPASSDGVLRGRLLACDAGWLVLRTREDGRDGWDVWVPRQAVALVRVARQTASASGQRRAATPPVVPAPVAASGGLALDLSSLAERLAIEWNQVIPISDSRRSTALAGDYRHLQWTYVVSRPHIYDDGSGTSIDLVVRDARQRDAAKDVELIMIYDRSARLRSVFVSSHDGKDRRSDSLRRKGDDDGAVAALLTEVERTLVARHVRDDAGLAERHLPDATLAVLRAIDAAVAR